VAREKRFDRACVGLVQPHPRRERLETPQDQPCRERRQAAAEVDQAAAPQSRDRLGSSDHRAAKRVAVTADVFGQRVDDVVGTEFEWAKA
jgi:hypothetical protein